MMCTFPSLQPPIDLADSVAPLKTLQKRAEFIVRKKLRRCILNQL